MSSSFLQSRNKPLLVAVDQAVVAYHGAQTGGRTAALHRIHDSVEAWLADKEAREVGSGRTGAMIHLKAAAEQELRALGQAPGMRFQILSGAMQQAAAAAGRFESKHVKVAVAQTITYLPGQQRSVWNAATNQFELQTVTVATPVKFAWNVNFTMQRYGTALVVKVRCNAKPRNSTVQMPASTRTEWSTHIQSAWNVATLVENGRHVDLQFDIEWVDDPEAYAINIDNPPPIPASTLVAARGQGAQAKAARAAVTSALSENTIDMGTWAWTDRQAVLHEFGHMIGCPDEYTVTALHGFGHFYESRIYDAPPYSTASIMNDVTSKGRVQDRHFQFLRKEYNKWRGTSADIRILGPGNVQPLDITLSQAMHQRRRMLMGEDA